METGSANERRYLQDVIREMHYQALRRNLSDQANRIIAGADINELRRLSRKEQTGQKNSSYAANIIRALVDLDVAYGQGDFDQACTILNRIYTLQKSLP
jgi:hypothetical protein